MASLIHYVNNSGPDQTAFQKRNPFHPGLREESLSCKQYQSVKKKKKMHYHLTEHNWRIFHTVVARTFFITISHSTAQQLCSALPFLAVSYSECLTYIVHSERSSHYIIKAACKKKTSVQMLQKYGTVGTECHFTSDYLFFSLRLFW